MPVGNMEFEMGGDIAGVSEHIPDDVYPATITSVAPSQIKYQDKPPKAGLWINVEIQTTRKKIDASYQASNVLGQKSYLRTKVLEPLFPGRLSQLEEANGGNTAALNQDISNLVDSLEGRACRVLTTTTTSSKGESFSKIEKFMPPQNIADGTSGPSAAKEVPYSDDDIPF